MPVVELLASHHERKGFDCGIPALNEFLQRQARQNADRHVGVTHVLVAEPGSSRVLGYYTLVTRTVERDLIAQGGLPRGPIDVALLGKLAIDLEFQGQGWGKRLLLRAMRQTAEAAKTVGIFALVLDAQDEQARGWYLSLDWGFQALLDNPNHLYLPVGTIQALKLTDDDD